MRGLRTLMLTLFSLFPSQSWSEEKLDFDWEKTNFQEIICYCESCQKSTIDFDLGERIYLFIEDNVVGITVETMGTDSVHVIEKNYGKFGRSPTRFSWVFANTITFSLDRKSLKLTKGYTDNIIKEIYTCNITLPLCVSKDICIGKGIWQSDLVEGYQNTWVDNLVSQRQKELDKVMETNQM